MTEYLLPPPRPVHPPAITTAVTAARPAAPPALYPAPGRAARRHSRPRVRLAPVAALLLVAYAFLFAIPRAGAWHACGASPYQAFILAGGFETPSLTECAALKWNMGR